MGQLRHQGRDQLTAPAADGEPLGPDGEPLHEQRRLTVRQARPWLKRSDVIVGIWPCGEPVRWLSDAERTGFVTSLRSLEGKDCNTDGDLLLFRLASGRRALVLEDLS